MDLLRQQVAEGLQEAEARRHTATLAPPPAPPPLLPPNSARARRSLVPITDGYSPHQDPGDWVDLATARAQVAREIDDYLALPDPAHVLLVVAPAGFGKSYQMVRKAESLALAPVVGEDGVPSRNRVFYAGPRHAFFQDLLREAQHPDLWYPWQPRQLANPEAGKPETCRYTPQMGEWLRRGYEAADFCLKVCGASYMKEECPYHLQKEVMAPILFGMHEHVWLNHALFKTCNVLIGDEYPIKLSTVLHEWDIPAAFVIPQDMPWDSPVLPILRALKTLTESDGHFEGIDLLNLLGGAEQVQERFGQLVLTGDLGWAPHLHHPDRVHEMPFAHLPDLARLLLREAEAAQGGNDYLARVIVAGGKLKLLLRRWPAAQVPKHIIWLDATGNQPLYEAAFGRPVRVVEAHIERQGTVFQVWNRMNNKTSLVDHETGDLTHRADQTRQQVEQIVQARGYRNVGVITFKDVKAIFEDFRTGHFGANRGTNEFNDVDALVVAGVPQPGLQDLVTIAKMLWHERMTLFQEGWSEIDVQYTGHPFAYAKSGFWADPDLNAVLWQHREAEIIQTVNRARILTRAVDVWLLANLPIYELPPDEIVSLHDLFEVPDQALIEQVLGKARRFDPHKWGAFVQTARRLCEENSNVIQREVVAETNLGEKTVREYWKLLKAMGWKVDQSEQALRPGRGKPPEALCPTLDT